MWNRYLSQRWTAKAQTSLCSLVTAFAVCWDLAPLDACQSMHVWRIINWTVWVPFLMIWFIWLISCLMTKSAKWLRPGKTQISLGIHPVWSVLAVLSVGSLWPKLSSCGQRRLIRLIQVFAGFVMRRLIWLIWIIPCHQTCLHGADMCMLRPCSVSCCPVKHDKVQTQVFLKYKPHDEKTRFWTCTARKDKLIGTATEAS